MIHRVWDIVKKTVGVLTLISGTLSLCMGIPLSVDPPFVFILGILISYHLLSN